MSFEAQSRTVVNGWGGCREKYLIKITAFVFSQIIYIGLYRFK